jgi:asparagine synthase (glutamine-hydrolysing)
VLVFDGRIDNRRELIAELSGGGVDAATDDAGLTLAAYRAWGIACPSRLIGDFAFGLWDEGARRLLCARDPLGVRSLYVLVREDLVGFATQLRQLRALCGQTPPLDMEYVADRLALGVDRPNSGRTPYRGLSRLEPGHRLVAESGRVRIERYWEWHAAGGCVHRSDEDYVEEFHGTFSEAVASRTSGSDPVWADLSGGLDSSSITSVACRLHGRPRLSPITVVFGESTWSDEREWAAEVQRAVGLDRHDIDGDVHHPFSRLAEAAQHWEEPHGAAVFFGVHERYARVMEGSGVPVLLSGIGAEAVVLSKHQEPVHLADLLRGCLLIQLWRELNRWQQALKMPLSSLALRYALGPLTGRAIRYPFLHRPLVELALAMPWSLKAVPGEPKAVLRRAMKGILPERVRCRTQNASTGHAAYNGLRKEWPVLERVVDSSVLVELGAVDRERLRTALHMARQGHAPDLGGLLSTLTLDAWLQHALHGRQRPGVNAEAA